MATQTLVPTAISEAPFPYLEEYPGAADHITILNSTTEFYGVSTPFEYCVTGLRAPLKGTLPYAGYEVYEISNLSNYGNTLNVTTRCKGSFDDISGPSGELIAGVRFILKIGGTKYYSDDILVSTGLWSTGTIETIEYDWGATSPDTGIDWTWEEIGLMEFGVELQSAFGGAMYAGEYELDVDYTPAIGPDQTITSTDEALAIATVDGSTISATGSITLSPDGGLIYISASDVILSYDEILSPDTAPMTITAHDATLLSHFLLEYISGGVFVNVDYFIDFALRTYAQFQGYTSVEIRDSFPQSKASIVGPLITYEMDFCTERPIEIGQKSVTYSLNYIVDTVGRTTLERDELTHLVARALNSRNPVLRQYGFVRYLGLDFVGQYSVQNGSKTYYGNSLRVRIEVDDHDNES